MDVYRGRLIDHVHIVVKDIGAIDALPTAKAGGFLAHFRR